MKTFRIIVLLFNIIAMNFNLSTIWVLHTIQSEKSIFSPIIWLVVNFVSAVILLHEMTKVNK